MRKFSGRGHVIIMIIRFSIDSIVKGLETSYVRPLKRVTNSTGNPRHELSQFHALEKERTRKIKEENVILLLNMRYLTTE